MKFVSLYPCDMGRILRKLMTEAVMVPTAFSRRFFIDCNGNITDNNFDTEGEFIGEYNSDAKEFLSPFLMEGTTSPSEFTWGVMDALADRGGYLILYGIGESLSERRKQFKIALEDIEL